MKASELKQGVVYVVRTFGNRIDYAIFNHIVETPTRYGGKPRKTAHITWLQSNGELAYHDTKPLSAIEYEYTESVEAFKIQRRLFAAQAAVKQAEYDAEKLALQQRLIELLGDDAGAVTIENKYGKPCITVNLDRLNALTKTK